MARIGVFADRNTLNNSGEMGAIFRLSHAAQKLGHRLDVIFRPEMYKIPSYDALFIRTLTDPLNASYAAARLAQMHGLRVIDDPDSIIICCDKVNMYRHLQSRKVPMPDTVFLDRHEITKARALELFDILGNPIVLKAPSGSFSKSVEKVHTPEEFVKFGRLYSLRACRIVAQRFSPSKFDWRVGVLGGEVLFVCQYGIPKNRWKIHTYDNGRDISGTVTTFRPDEVNPLLLETAKQAAAAIGTGFYGVDLKQIGQSFIVIEVNDNPTIEEDEEDQDNPQLYEKIIRYLAGNWG
jgi:glutathione synthase/RimK-type ligase-like ATP-grasp enzyme